jgi:uncharacterized circularly permuted ATP-grasp superfamily protein
MARVAARGLSSGPTTGPPGRASLDRVSDTAQARANAAAADGDVSAAAWDEALDTDGEPRPHYGELIAALEDGTDLTRLAIALQATIDVRGVDFSGDTGPARFSVDAVPRIVEPSEWDLLRRGLAQRVQALIAFVADVYGERAIVAAGILPARVVDTAEHLEPDMIGVPVSNATYVAGLDLVRGADGRLRVLEDNLRTPSGIAYALALRTALDEHLPLPPPQGRVDSEPVYELLGDALRAAAPGGVDDPTVVLLSDGSSNSAWYEHRVLAERLGIPIVLPRDLRTRDDRALARLEDGHTHEVDVVYRRTDEDRLRDSRGNPTWLAEALLEPLKAGAVAVVNPFGSGVADDKLVHAYVEEMVRFYCGEEPLIESVRTYDLCDPDVLAEVLPRLDELVVKPRSGYGGEGVVVCPHATAADRAEARRRVTAQPDAYIAQDLVAISTHPTVRDGRLEPRHVDLRPFAIGAGGSVATAPVALTRVALDAGSLVVNSSQNGGGKDTWLMA